MSVTTAEKLMTADELLLLPRGKCRYELIKGKLLQKPLAGFEHGVVTVDIARPLGIFVRENNLGVTLGAETGFKIETNPDTVRAPDVAFVSAARLPQGTVRGFFPGAPDLAVEVASPGDTLQEIEDKVSEWLAAGAQLVWIVRPARRTVEVHRADETMSLLGIQDELSGESVVPGFWLPIARIFR